ncbi:WD40-repeat-containing domain protein [Paraphoma chrysanthemicola]|uniref:WD40-repeat-containing domain protein n=1 Tax=Paraphoma chrysanthemicola TaxID=798071 RepID=A0A8K0QUM3_9PLEO|nr:WD40-repeat-containing domain protein [Paraphoma chrysanthemicola]
MAVDDFLSRDTEHFVLPSKSFYRTKIPIAHYQLRHFISSPEPDLIYYASGYDVYCLNAVTRTQAHVTTLPWEARCTASGHGFVCVGGADDGNFAAIQVAGFPPADPSQVDASLPLDLQHRVPRPPLLGAAHRIRLEKIGEDIVNSISIHKFPAEGDTQDDVVAVLTNNDKTVRLYSLTQHLELTVLDLPFAMNHATISPDGQLLVAVGDTPTAYFFERVKMDRPSSMKTPEGRMQLMPPEWQLLQQVALYRPTSGPCADGYFSTAWSPLGRLCAVGSECGYITVFDIEQLKKVEYGEDAVVQLISSTRPDTTAGAGAVRTMHFSPNPWDFLVWSEDQGRVCVADLRSGLKVKQMLQLDPSEEGLERIEIADFDVTINPEMHELRREADFIRSYRRALDSDGTAAAVNAATEYFEADSERQRHRRLGVVESDNDPHGLTAHERQVLEALRTTRQREEAREQGITPRSINYNTSRHVDSASRREQMEVMAEFVPESFRRWTRSTQERTTPRRQASVVVSIDPNTVNVPPSHTNITDSATTRSPNVIPAHARRVTSEIINSTDDAWRTIEEALTSQARAANETARAATSNATNANNPSTSSATEFRTELRRLRQLTQMRERLRNARASQPSVETYEFSLGLRRPSRSLYDPSHGVRTAGLAMSQDGRTLYCGTEEGIFEFKLNLHVRKGFPAVHPR